MVYYAVVYFFYILVFFVFGIFKEIGNLSFGIIIDKVSYLLGGSGLNKVFAQSIRCDKYVLYLYYNTPHEVSFWFIVLSFAEATPVGSALRRLKFPSNGGYIPVLSLW